MAATSHHVTFRFRLPPVLLLRAPIGAWPRCPRGVSLYVAEDGAVDVVSIDHHVTYAIAQVLKAAARFLADSDIGAPATRLRAELSTPVTRASGAGHPVRYSIALGAKVSITRVLIEEEPVLVGEAPRLHRVA